MPQGCHLSCRISIDSNVGGKKKAGTAPKAVAPPRAGIRYWPFRQWEVGLEGGRGSMHFNQLSFGILLLCSSCSLVANFVLWVAWSGKGTGRGCLSIEQAAEQ